MLPRETLFDALFVPRRRAIFGFFLGGGASRDEAMDMTQETFARLWSNVDRVTAMPEDDRARWLFGVARHVAGDARRRRRTSASPLTETVVDPQPGPESSATTDLIGREIAALPDAQRQAFVMATVGGMSSDEIGLALGRSAGTVRSDLKRARERLRERLTEEFA